jgi:hypothetical protein
MNITEAIKQISRLKILLSLPTTDVIWSNYNSADEVIKDLEDIEKGLKRSDKNAVDRLYFLLAPTGSLQEISISSGWGNEYLEIAATLEKSVGK